MSSFVTRLYFRRKSRRLPDQAVNSNYTMIRERLQSRQITEKGSQTSREGGRGRGVA